MGTKPGTVTINLTPWILAWLVIGLIVTSSFNISWWWFTGPLLLILSPFLIIFLFVSAVFIYTMIRHPERIKWEVKK